MKTLACTDHADDKLEEYRRGTSEDQWELAVSGYWSEGPFHSGHIAYYVQRTSPHTWVLSSVERNAELDAVTQEDVDEGCLNDDHIQAMWGMTLQEAQSHNYQQIVAVLLDAPDGLSSKEAARHLYDAVQTAHGKIVDESDLDGLLD
jgi:hypothetical protein